MTHSKCGLLLLLAAGGLSACGGDPTGSFQEQNETIVATPSSSFLSQGASSFVIAERRDAQGNQLSADFTIMNVGPQITVTPDSTFLETTNGTTITTRQRFIVTGVSPGASSFTLATGDLTLDVPVKVLPTSLVADFSSLTPASNEPVTLSAAGYTFLPGTTVFIGADSAIVLYTAPDGSSVTFLPPPGATGAATVSGAAIDFAPTAPLTLTTTTSITVGPLTALAGTNSPATAPAFTAASGTTAALYDTGSFGSAVCGGNSGVPCQVYKFTAPVDGDYAADLTWSNSTDLGLYVLSADGTTDIGPSCDGLGNGADGGNEACTLTLTAGDYILGVVNFGPFYAPPDPAPDSITLTIVAP